MVVNICIYGCKNDNIYGNLLKAQKTAQDRTLIVTLAKIVQMMPIKIIKI
jgi:hypothetical protein